MKKIIGWTILGGLYAALIGCGLYHPEVATRETSMACALIVAVGALVGTAFVMILSD